MNDIILIIKNREVLIPKNIKKKSKIVKLLNAIEGNKKQNNIKISITKEVLKLSFIPIETAFLNRNLIGKTVS